MRFIITTKNCTGCGTCTEICPTEAIKIENGKALITMDCIDCGACPRVCPEGAISQTVIKHPSPTVKTFQED